MSHFEVSNNHIKVKVPGQDPQKSNSLTGIDSLLVFWPDGPDDLSHRGFLASCSRQHQNHVSTTLLVGYSIQGHSSEAALVVIGTVRSGHADNLVHKAMSMGLVIMGSYSTSGSGSIDSNSIGCPIWLTVLEPPSPNALPAILSVRFRGTESANGSARRSQPSQMSNEMTPCAVSLIRYSVPNTEMLQYFALESLRMAPVSGMKLVATASTLLQPDDQLADFSRLMASNSAPSKLQNKFLQLLCLDPEHWRSLRSIQPQQGLMPRGTALRRAIELINSLHAEERRSAHPADSSLNPNGTADRPHTDKSEDRRAQFQPLKRFGIAVTSVALAIQSVLRYPLYTPKDHSVMIDGVVPRPISKRRELQPLRLISISACARQVDVRLSQFIVAPRLASRLRYLRKQQKLPIDELAAPYIGLWNAVWLIANDIILGNAVGILLVLNQSLLANACRGLLERYSLKSVLWLLSWLENWPAGLKLNTELSLFFSDAYSSLAIAWHAQGLAHLLPRLEAVVVLMAGVGRCMGVTMMLCMLQDLVSICTLHITVFYTISFRMLCAFVYVLSALFDVFRGKKRNALRGGRLDDASYELDQLLLGTLLFTLAAFLFPTVYVYYLAFGLIRLAVVSFEVGIVGTALGLLNHLPLFALLLRFKDPHRLPAGVWLQDVGQSSNPAQHSSALKTGRFRLRSRPLTVSGIFEGYSQHVDGLFEVPTMILRCVFGRPLRRAESCLDE